MSFAFGQRKSKFYLNQNISRHVFLFAWPLVILITRRLNIIAHDDPSYVWISSARKQPIVNRRTNQTVIRKPFEIQGH